MSDSDSVIIAKLNAVKGNPADPKQVAGVETEVDELLYYDRPQVWTFRDGNGTLKAALHIGYEGQHDCMLIVPVTEDAIKTWQDARAGVTPLFGQEQTAIYAEILWDEDRPPKDIQAWEVAVRDIPPEFMAPNAPGTNLHNPQLPLRKLKLS
jgi:hypothetical protein